MQHNISPAVAAIIVIVMIGAATAGVASLKTKIPTGVTSSGNSPATQQNPSTSPRSTPLTDGVYSAQGTYSTPGGKESIGLTVTLKNNIIHDIDLKQNAKRGDSIIYQSKFASGYKPLVQGMDISDVKLTRVAGSSLTSSGFNQALESIKRDAAS